jgi:NFU1 iron-sulfur cluster scaffold homolog, mitochondrial
MSDAPARRRIRAQASAGDPKVMGFVLDEVIRPGPSVSFEAAGEVPLARALFGLDGVARVEVSGATIWVKRQAEADWAMLKPAIAGAIRHVLDETDAPLGRGDTQTDPDGTLRDAVEDLLDRQVNPAVAAHGGHIAVDRVEGSAVYLRMSGGCQGCAASAATLREGVERMLRAALPQIGEIVDVTDHAAGQSPFYGRNDGPSPILNRPVPHGVIGWDDGQIVVDPDYLAPRLGLTAETLRDGLRSGDVVGVTETGEGADEGMTRIILRSGTRAWAAEVDATGAAREIPPPRVVATAAGREQTLSQRVRAHLETLTVDAAPITYGALARALGLWAPGSVQKVTRALETTMREDAAAGHPFIAARVVSRARGGLPGQGFFDLANALSRGPGEGEDQAEFHSQRPDEQQQRHADRDHQRLQRQAQLQ